MYSRSSFANFFSYCYRFMNGDPETRARLKYEFALYCTFGSLYTARALWWVFCYETEVLCPKTIAGGMFWEQFPLLLNNSSIIMVLFFSVFQVVFYIEHMLKKIGYELFADDIQDYFHALQAISGYSFKQTLVYDTSRIYLRNLPFRCDAYKDMIWIVLVMAEFSSRVIFKIALFLSAILMFFWMKTTFLTNTFTNFLLISLDFSLFAAYSMNALLLLFHVWCYVILIERSLTFVLRYEARKLRRVRYQRGSLIRFVHQVSVIIPMYSHYLRKMTRVDDELVKNIYSSLALLALIFNICCISAFMQNHLTLLSISYLLAVIVIFLSATFVAAETFVYISSSLIVSRREILAFHASGKARIRTTGLSNLFLYSNFAEIVHNRKRFCFSLLFYFGKLSHNGIFKLLLLYLTGTIFITTTFSI